MEATHIREIPKFAECPLLDDADQRTLSDLCFRNDILENADLIFVFGNNVQQEELARLRVRLRMPMGERSCAA